MPEERSRLGPPPPLGLRHRRQLLADLSRLEQDANAPVDDGQHVLASVVSTGTGGAAEIPGYQVAGKTGTARKLVDGRYVRRYMASFVGFLPASDPRVVIAVSIDEPRTIYGGVAAAPVFSEIARHVIQRLAIPAAPPVSLPPFATDP